MDQPSHNEWLNTLIKSHTLKTSWLVLFVLIGMAGLEVRHGLTLSLAQERDKITSPPYSERDSGKIVDEDPSMLFVKGKVLDIMDDRVIIVKGIDGEVKLHLTPDTRFKGSVHIGDHIAATVSPNGNVRQISVIETGDLF